MQSNYFSGIPAAACPMPERVLGLGTVVDGKYEVVGPPYGGKCKALYRCRSKRPFAFGRDVMLSVPFSQSDSSVGPFKNEQKALTRVSHPGIVKLVHYGTCDKYGPYTALELVEGPTLAGLVRQDRRLELDRAIGLFLQICSALAYLHKECLMHGSLKANHIILLQKPNHATEAIKLIDLSQTLAPGQKRVFSTPDLNELFQTVGHPSPEELRQEPIDQRAEIYALGCMLYKVLTGKAPFNGSSAEEIKQKHISEPVPGLQGAFPQASFPVGLDECLAKMLAKKPSDRQQTIDDLSLDLRFAARRV